MKSCETCGKPVSGEGCPDGPGTLLFCDNDCAKIYDTLHGLEWIPVEDTMPGKKHDGIWENSGLKLRKPKQ